MRVEAAAKPQDRVLRAFGEGLGTGETFNKGG